MQCISQGCSNNVLFISIFSLTLLLSGCGNSTDPGKDPNSTDVTANQAPVAMDDALTVMRGSVTALNLAANDTDADDGIDLNSISLSTTATHGSLLVNSNGTVNYTHDGGVSALDSFSYRIRDNAGELSNSATVNITITPTLIPLNVKVGIYDSTVVEAADDLEFVISLFSASSETVSLDYATRDGTAIAGRDYITTSGTLQFAPGEVRKFVSVRVLDNPASATTSSRNMQLVLSNPRFAEITDDMGSGTIIDRHSMSADSSFNHNWAQTGAFSNAASCATSCHKASASKMTYQNRDISPGTRWRHSVMANAFADPYWQAAVEDEVDSYPQLTGFIEDTCNKCHAPMGRTDAYHSGSSLDSDGFYRFDTAKTQMHAREGVSCTVCHQINVDASSNSGNYFILGDSTHPEYKDIYGPYDSPSGNNMNRQTGHQPVASSRISSSELCATCHTLYTPSLDPETGAPNGISFLEQGPFLEWKNSIYASGKPDEAQCQDCHMPEPVAGYATPISLQPSNSPIRTPYAQHTLAGGNIHLLEILRDYRTQLGIDGATSVEGFNEQIALTQNFLATAASLSISALQVGSSDVQFSIGITNHSGHKIPSAYPSRRIWLEVIVKDSNDNIIFESGRPDARGYLSTDADRLKADCMSAHKLEGFDSQHCFEVHRDTINDSSQIAIYETVLGDSNGHITHTLLQGATYLKDNRIPPAGFTNATAAIIEPQTLPAGVTGDNDFNCLNSTEGCGSDSVHYRVNTQGQAGPFSVQSRLLYQATQPGFVDGMHNTGDRVNRFKLMYDVIPPTVEVLAVAARP